MKPLFADPQARIAALVAYDLLDTGAEAELDALTRLAAYIAQTPIALITLLDERRQWFKSKVGLSISQTPIEQAFCRYTIEQDQVMEVADAHLDERFAQNPLVIGDPHIRYYCGLPLITPEGYPLGSLCVIDQTPRTLTPMQQEALQTLASEVMARLELKRQKKVVDSQKKQLEQINTHLEQLVVQRTQALQAANTALTLTKDELESFLYRASHDLKGPLSSLQGLLQLVQVDTDLLGSNQYVLHMQQTTQKLDQVMGSLLTYSTHVQTTVNCQRIDFKRLVDETFQSLQQVKGYERVQWQAHIQAGEPFFSDRERLGVMLTNVLKNSIVFQNFNLPQAHITVWIDCDRQQARLIIRDDGIGIAQDQLDRVGHRFSRFSDQSTGSGLGLFIVGQLVSKLKGCYRVQSQQGKGTTVTMMFPNLYLTRPTI